MARQSRMPVRLRDKPASHHSPRLYNPAWIKRRRSCVATWGRAQPAFFRGYLIEQLTHLVEDYGAELSVRVSETEIPYSFVLEAAGAKEFGGGLSDWLPPSVVANLIARKVVMPPSQTTSAST